MTKLIIFGLIDYDKSLDANPQNPSKVDYTIIWLLLLRSICRRLVHIIDKESSYGTNNPKTPYATFFSIYVFEVATFRAYIKPHSTSTP